VSFTMGTKTLAFDTQLPKSMFNYDVGGVIASGMF
jgi:hypothetical protein